MSQSHGLGTVRYKDPKSFEDEAYIRGGKSDIFSLVVILWEISSGKVSCASRTDDRVVVYRLRGFRDDPFPGTPEEYEKLYMECWDEDPDERPFCENVYKRLKMLQYCDALDDFNKLLEIEPSNAHVLSRRGSIYQNLERYDDALVDFNKSLEIEPNNEYSLSRRGSVYLDLKQYNDALILSDINQSLEIEQNDAWALNLRGSVYCNLKQYDD